MSSSSHTPTHPELFEVGFGDSKSFSSKLIAKKDFPARSIITHIQGCEATHVKAYSSVQIAADPTKDGSPAHIELMSDLLYVNHSCNPNVAFEVPGGLEGMHGGKWVVRALTNIKAGDMLTFAYFSTEWDMAQAFDCTCASSRCLGTIKGAKHISEDVLKNYFVNEHIAELKENEWLMTANGRDPGFRGRVGK